MHTLSLYAIPNIPEIKAGDDLATILGDAIEAAGLSLQDGDVLTSAHKIFSKAEGRIISLADVTPSEDAQRYAQELNKDPRKVEVILQQSSRVVRHFKRPAQHEGTMICEHKLGFISANAAVDESNSGADETLILLPEDQMPVQHACNRRFLNASAPGSALPLRTHSDDPGGLVRSMWRWALPVCQPPSRNKAIWTPMGACSV